MMTMTKDYRSLSGVPSISEATAAMIATRGDIARKQIYCDIAEWTSREMIGELKQSRRRRGPVNSPRRGRGDSNDNAAAAPSMDTMMVSPTTTNSNSDDDVGFADDNDDGDNDEETEEFLFTEDDLSRMRELKDRRRRQRRYRDSTIDRQLAEYQKSSHLSRMFAQLIKRPKYREIVDRLRRMVQRRDRPLSCRHDCMLAVYSEHLHAYRSICPEFMGHLLRENVLPSIRQHYRQKSPPLLILLHLFNATPSVTLSQFYFYVFGKNFCLGEVCEFFMNICDSVADQLFVQRTRFLLQRYQRLGDGRAVAILDKMCICEMVLFPMLLRRCNSSMVHDNDDRDDLERWTASSGARLLRSGACVAADELYARIYKRTDVLDLAFDFVRANAIKRKRRQLGRGEDSSIAATRQSPLGDNDADEGVSHRDLCNELLRSRQVLELANLLHWRFNGSMYLDPANDENVVPRNADALPKYIAAKYLLYIKERDDRATVFVDHDKEEDNPRGGTGGSKQRQRNRKTGDGGEMPASVFRTRLIEVMEVVSKSYRGSILGGAANSVTGNTNENVSRDSGQPAVVGGLTLDKFVRYMDKRSTHPIMLNLYLNRFELSTPAVSRLLSINYDDGNPPQRYRFNEVCDRKINRFVHCAVEEAKSYFETVCSRDVINHYLYSKVVSERAVGTSSSNGRQHTAAAAANDGSCGDGEIWRQCDDTRQQQQLEDTSTATVSILQQFDRPFTCDVSDLLNLLPQTLNSRDARDILLHSHPFARAFSIVLLNAARSFSTNLLRDSARRIVNVLVEPPPRSSDMGLAATSDHLLYAPLGCRSYLDYNSDDGRENGATAKTERMAEDVFVKSRRFLQHRGRRSVVVVAATAVVDAEHEEERRTIRDTREENGGDPDRVGASTATADIGSLLCELNRMIDSKKNYNVSDSSNSSDESDSLDELDDAMITTAPRRLKDLTNEHVFSVTMTASDDYDVVTESSKRRRRRRRRQHDRRYVNAGECPDTVRNYIASWRLHEFARNRVNDPALEHWISSAAATSGDEANIVVNMAVAFLFLLVRERERRVQFLRCGDKDGKSLRFTCDDESRMNIFARLTDTRSSLFDECYASLCRMYPECNIHSYDTNSLASGLAAYVSARPEGRGVPNDIAYGLSVAVTTLHVFSRGDKDVVLFFLRYITAIRFPGQFFKTILLLQGTSDSGKSDFVSEVLRANFSCLLSGTLSNATLRQGIKDEVNTDLMSMMKSHICQVDEPEKMNSELFKNLVSTTMMKSRYFHQQQSQYLRNLAKIILTVNDAISLRSDAGVITRLKFCLRMVHRFKPLHNRRFDTGVDFVKNNTTPSVCYQFATRCFAKGVNFADFRTGLFLAMEHYGIDMCTYNEATYALYDAVSARLADVARHGDELCSLSSSSSNGTAAAAGITRDDEIRLQTLKDDLTLFRKMITFNLTERVVAMYRIAVNDDDDYDDDDEPTTTKKPRLTGASGRDDDNYRDSMMVVAASTDEDDDEENDEEDIVVDVTATAAKTAARNLSDVLLPSELRSAVTAVAMNRRAAENKRAMRIDAATRNKSVLIFRDTASAKLEDPVLIDELPDAMVRDARNLHVMIDPFESLQQRYRIYEDPTLLMRDTDLYRFLREFIEQSGYLVSRVNFREMVVKLKERIKTDYPNAFDDKTQTFHLTFVPK